MIRPVGWRVPAGGGVAHFFEVDTEEPRRPWTLCGKVRRHTPYLHPILHGVEEDWRPCRDCFARWHTLERMEVEA